MNQILFTYCYFPWLHFRGELYYFWSSGLSKSKFGSIKIQNELYAICCIYFMTNGLGKTN